MSCYPSYTPRKSPYGSEWADVLSVGDTVWVNMNSFVGISVHRGDCYIGPAKVDKIDKRKNRPILLKFPFPIKYSVHLKFTCSSLWIEGHDITHKI